MSFGRSRLGEASRFVLYHRPPAYVLEMIRLNCLSFFLKQKVAGKMPVKHDEARRFAERGKV